MTLPDIIAFVRSTSLQCLDGEREAYDTIRADLCKGTSSSSCRLC